LVYILKAAVQFFTKLFILSSALQEHNDTKTIPEE